MPSAGPLPAGPEEPVLTPEEQFDLEVRLGRVAEEKKRALAEPGPSWRQWWFHDASKWYVGLAFLILDVWVVAYGFEAGALFGAVGILVVAGYAEFLLYRYLYYRPHPGDHGGARGFRRTFTRPVPFGRWTPEADLVRAGGTLVPEEEGPSPKEFL
jgi:hypothetical protein